MTPSNRIAHYIIHYTMKYNQEERSQLDATWVKMQYLLLSNSKIAAADMIRLHDGISNLAC